MIALLRKMAEGIRKLKRLKRLRPLTAWKAWHRGEPRTSQRTALQQLGLIVTCWFGGNRSGKTALLKAVIVAWCLGSDHPMVQVWARLNDFDLSQIPRGPGQVWLVALTSSDSVRYHRNDIAALLPKGKTKWYNREGRGEARVKISVAGYEDEAIIWFKSADQGREGMQGDNPRAIGLDEEVSESVFQECLIRIADASGRIFLAMTPLKGLTWVYRRFVEKEDPIAKTHFLKATDNPNVPASFLRKLYAGMSKAERAAREEGKFVALEGRVYPMWDRRVHVIASFEIPEDWPRYRVMDFGVRNPTAILWAALGPDDTLYVYREHYQAGWSLGQHARHIRTVEGWHELDDAIEDEWRDRARSDPGFKRPRTYKSGGRRWFRMDDTERISNAWADPAGKQQIEDLRRDHGISHRKANNNIEAGISAAIERLIVPIIESHTCEKCDGDGWVGDPKDADVCPHCDGGGEIVDEHGKPAVRVLENCVNFVREIENYVRPSRDRARTDQTEKPLKREDHAMDGFRYLCMGTKRKISVG